MNLSWSEEEQALRETARAFLAEQPSGEPEPALWKAMAELGWTALPVPEACGGLGLGPVALTALLEETGAALLAAPLFSTLALGAGALLETGSEAQQRRWLPGIASGELRATLAFAARDGRYAAARVGVAVEGAGSGARLRGEAGWVMDGAEAELLIVAAREPAGGVSLFAVPAESERLRRTPLATLDPTRRFAALAFDGVPLGAAERLGEPGAGWPRVERVLERAAVALAAEQVGGAERCLELALAHAGERVQFGRPIGSFQAVQHRCAEMALQVETARSAAYAAACLAEAADPELPLAAAAARAWCSEAYFDCAGEALQLHGGIGFTWEAEVQRHLKRARSMRSWLGSPARARERVARAIGLGDGAPHAGNSLDGTEPNL